MALVNVISVADPHPFHFDTAPDPTSDPFRENTDPDPAQIEKIPNLVKTLFKSFFG